MSKDMGRKVAEVKWPFYRYDVLMPEQVRSDLFVWLYLSIVVLKNKEAKKAKDSYALSETEQAKKVLAEKFSSVIDTTTLDRIIINAEHGFVSSTDPSHGIVSKTIKADAFEFLSTFENMFSEQVQIKRIFKDGVTGEVVPFFGDTDSIEDWRADLDCISPISKSRPKKSQIIRALKIYAKNQNSEMVNAPNYIDEDEQFVDPDEEVEFSINEGGSLEEVSAQKPQSRSRFNLIYLENTECLFRLKVEIYVKDNKFWVTTPFDREVTYSWFNKQFGLARKSGQASDLATLMADLEQNYIVPEIVLTDDVLRKDISRQLNSCGTIYRLIEHTGNNDLKRILIKVDGLFHSRSEDYFNNLGHYLECLVEPLKDYSNTAQRVSYDYRQFCQEIEAACQKLGVDGSKLFNKDVYNNWQKAWDNFKADVANLFFVIKNLNSCKSLYFDFISDMVSLYGKRSDGSHYKKDKKLQFSKDQIDKLEKITKVIVDLYEV